MYVCHAFAAYFRASGSNQPIRSFSNLPSTEPSSPDALLEPEQLEPGGPREREEVSGGRAPGPGQARHTGFFGKGVGTSTTDPSPRDMQ